MTPYEAFFGHPYKDWPEIIEQKKEQCQEHYTAHIKRNFNLSEFERKDNTKASAYKLY